MKGGTLLLLVADIVALMKDRGIITETGDFDDTKLDTLQEDAQFALDVEVLLVHHGVKVPGKVDAIIKALPVLGLFLR